MAQITVKDSAGDDQTVAKVTNTGSAADSESLPVASSTEDKAVAAAAAASLAVIDDWDESDRAKVNPIVGQAGVAAGAGAVGATVQRVTLASDDPAVTTLGAVADAAVVAGATGSLSAKLRSISRDIAALIAQIPASLGIKTAVNSLSVAPASDAVFATSAPSVTPTDRSATITSGGTAQQLMAANSSRRGFSVQNLSSADLWISEVGTAAATQPSMRIAAGRLYESHATGAPSGAISIFGATTGQAFASREW